MPAITARAKRRIGAQLIRDRRFIGRVHTAATARLQHLARQLPLSVLLDLHAFVEPMTQRPAWQRGPARHVPLLPDQFDKHADRIAALI